jgi:hypothetical protein
MQCDRIGCQDSGAKGTSKKDPSEKDPGKEEVSMAPPIFTLVEDGDGKFVIYDNAIKLAAPLNYDTAPSHRVTVAVSGVTPAVANKTFTITVIDVDPVISLSETAVLETATVGTFVGNFSISDATGTPVYTLVDSAGGKFAIDGNTLEVAGPLDFATSAFHSITVSASGVTPASENRTFTISILEATSVIALSSSSMLESITTGTVIGELSVLGGTGTYTFTIVDDPDGLFSIDSDDLDKVGIVDYETNTSHEVTIQADNGAGDVVTQTLTITVTNVGDTTTPEVPPPGTVGEAIFGRGVYINPTATPRQYMIAAGLYMNEVV